MPGRYQRRQTSPQLRLVGADEAGEPATDDAHADAIEALLIAREGYQAAGDAAEGAAVPSLSDFVD